MAFTEDSPMPWGEHFGKPLKDVPAWWLLWVYDLRYPTGDLLEYIKANMNALAEDAQQEPRNITKPRRSCCN